MSHAIAAALAANALAAHPGSRPPCQTPHMMEFGRSMAGASARPDSVGYVDSAVYPIRVHYRRADDAERAATVVMTSVEDAWTAEVLTMGWPAPPSDDGLGGNDSFDYYLSNDGTYGGAWTWGPPTDVVEGDDYFSVASFVVLDDTGSITDEYMPDFVAHEFNHALQFTIDGHERTSFVWESTAEAMEELVCPDLDLYFLDIPSFQKLPFESLLFDSYDSQVTDYDSYSFYEYGGAISGLYLEQAYGNNDGKTLLQLWLDLAQGDSENEPDYIDALGLIGGAAAPTYEDVYMGLAEWRMFVNEDDDGAHYEEADRWNSRSKVATEDTLSLAAISGTWISPADAPYDLGTSYWEISPDDDLTVPLHLEVEGSEDKEWGIVAAVWLDGQPARVEKVWGAEGEIVDLDVDLTGATKIMVGVVNLGAADLDAEARHTREDFTLTFQHGDADTGVVDDTAGDDTAQDDTAEDPGPKDTGTTKVEGGCGCATTESPTGPMALAALLLGAAFGLRRRP